MADLQTGTAGSDPLTLPGNLVIPENIVSSVMAAESGGDPNAVSRKGAVGPMQLMGPTAKDMGVTDIHDPAQNIAGGKKYLQQLYKMYQGDVDKTLAAYNWGPGNVAKHGMDNLPDETRKYIQKVKGAQSAESIVDSWGKPNQSAESIVDLWDKQKADNSHSSEEYDAKRAAILSNEYSHMGGDLAGAAKGIVQNKDPTVDYSGVDDKKNLAVYSFLNTPSEKMAYLRQVYGPQNVTTSSYGQPVIIQNGKKMAFVPKNFSLGQVASWLGDVPPVAGMIAGGLASGGVGSIPGAAAGAAAGSAISHGLKYAMGLNQQTPSETAMDVGKEAALGATGEVAGRGINMLGRTILGPWETGSLIGALNKESAEQYAKQQAAFNKSTAYGFIPGVKEAQPRSAFLATAQQVAHNVFGKYISVANKRVAELYDKALNGTPSMTATELQDALPQAADKAITASETQAAQAMIKADSLLQSAKQSITAKVGAPSPELASTISNEIKAKREAFAEEASKLYAPIDAYVGEPAVPTSGLKEKVTQIMAKRAKTAKGKIVGQPMPMLDRILEMSDKTTFVEMQDLRHELSSMSEAEALNAGVSAGRAKLLAGAADRAFTQAAEAVTKPKIPVFDKQVLADLPTARFYDDRFDAALSKLTQNMPPDMAEGVIKTLRDKQWTIDPKEFDAALKSVVNGPLREAQNALTAEAVGSTAAQDALHKRIVEGLRFADSFYQHGIQKFKDLTVAGLVKDATQGGFVQPELITEHLVRPDQVSRLEAVRNMVTPETFQKVAANHWDRILTKSTDPLTGSISGARLAGLLRGKENDLVFGANVGPIRKYAYQLAALGGRINPATLGKGDIAKAIQDAVEKTKAANDIVKHNIIGAIRSNGPESLLAADNITSPKGLLKFRQILKALGPDAPEIKALKEYLARRIFDKMVVPASADAAKYLDTEISGKELKDELNLYGRAHLTEIMGKEWTDSAFDFADAAEVGTRDPGGMSSIGIVASGALRATPFLHKIPLLHALINGEVLSKPIVLKYLNGGFAHGDFIDRLRKVLGTATKVAAPIETQKLSNDSQKKTEATQAMIQGATQ